MRIGQYLIAFMFPIILLNSCTVKDPRSQTFDVNSSLDNTDNIKIKAVSAVVKSDVFKEFSKKYPKNTKFEFPLQMVVVPSNDKCDKEVTVYIDEGDHYSLVASFVVECETLAVYLNKTN